MIWVEDCFPDLQSSLKKRSSLITKQAPLLITQIHQFFTRHGDVVRTSCFITWRNTRRMAQTISLALNTLAGVLKAQLKRRAFAWLQILPQKCFAEIRLKFSRDKDKFPYGGIPSSLLRVRGSIEPQSDLASITLNPAGLPVNHGNTSNIISQISTVFNWLRKDGTEQILQFRIRRSRWIEALKKKWNRVSLDVK